eukprot:1159175-Pelagomonas_calceolata.AAC.22
MQPHAAKGQGSLFHMGCTKAKDLLLEEVAKDSCLEHGGEQGKPGGKQGIPGPEKECMDLTATAPSQVGGCCSYSTKPGGQGPKVRSLNCHRLEIRTAATEVVWAAPQLELSQDMGLSINRSSRRLLFWAGTATVACTHVVGWRRVGVAGGNMRAYL